MRKNVLAAIGLAMGLGLTTAHAQSDQAATAPAPRAQADVPGRGLSMAQVEQRYGPASTRLAIGGSDAFLLMGFVLMWLLSPATGWSLNNPQIPLQGEFAHAAFIFLLIAAFAKAGAFPLHTWVPDFSQNPPVESAAFLTASLDKLLGIFLLAKMLTSLFVVYPLINMILISLGALTVISAVMMAMIQHNGYRLLGSHAVSQVGYMVMGVASGSVLAFAGGLFHMINHTIYKSNLFLSFGSVEKRAGTAELDYLGGLGKNMPITFLMAFALRTRVKERSQRACAVHHGISAARRGATVLLPGVVAFPQRMGYRIATRRFPGWPFLHLPREGNRMPATDARRVLDYHDATKHT